MEPTPAVAQLRRRKRRKPAAERKTHNLTFAATDADRDAFLAAARSDGQSLSAWIRRILLRQVGALPPAREAAS